jgi:hypothetical protein
MFVPSRTFSLTEPSLTSRSAIGLSRALPDLCDALDLRLRRGRIDQRRSAEDPEDRRDVVSLDVGEHQRRTFGRKDALKRHPSNGRDLPILVDRAIDALDEIFASRAAR